MERERRSTEDSESGRRRARDEIMRLLVVRHVGSHRGDVDETRNTGLVGYLVGL